MKRITWAGVAGTLAVAFLVSGCGNLKKDEFLPEYESFKAENESRISTAEAAIEEHGTKIAALEQADQQLAKTIEDAVADAKATAEAGDADTLGAAKEFASEQDGKLRDELSGALRQAAAEAQSAMKSGDAEVKRTVMAALEDAKAGAMSALQNVSKSADSGLEALRAQVADMLARAIPVDVATVYFATASAKLTDETIAALDKAIEVINENPDAVVQVTGHADARPILSGKYLTNLQLSEARAQSVADYLKSKGVMNKIEVSGRGHFETEGSQSTTEGQNRSRRVVVQLVVE